MSLLAAAVRSDDRAALARAITLVESTRPEHRREAEALLTELLPHAGGAIRIGLTGVPGVGKSTLIDQLGVNLTAAGHKVAVLAVDPSSARTGGSILGDKTRMPRLSQDPHAFIRPSPSAGLLGGVARRTREALLICEAAGFDVVIVETVGVGQSETAVAGLVDTFVALMLPGAGDELQGLKKGLIEIADILAINKADGEALAPARRAASDYEGALNIIAPAEAGWRTPVLLVSGRDNQGLDGLWRAIEDHRRTMSASGRFAERRKTQSVAAFREDLREMLLARMLARPEVAAALARLEADVREGRLAPTAAAAELAQIAGVLA